MTLSGAGFFVYGNDHAGAGTRSTAAQMRDEPDLTVTCAFGERVVRAAYWTGPAQRSASEIVRGERGSACGPPTKVAPGSEFT